MDPVPVSQICPLAVAEMVPETPAASAKVSAYFACVQDANASNEQVQAASWVRDWFLATACIHRCDREAIDSLAHGPLWKGLHYIVAVTLPEHSTAGSCVQARQAVLSGIDDRLLHLKSYSATEAGECDGVRARQSFIRQHASTKASLEMLMSRKEAYLSH